MVLPAHNQHLTHILAQFYPQVIRGAQKVPPVLAPPSNITWCGERDGVAVTKQRRQVARAGSGV